MALQLPGSSQVWHWADSEFSLQLQSRGDVFPVIPRAADSLSLPSPRTSLAAFPDILMAGLPFTVEELIWGCASSKFKGTI